MKRLYEKQKKTRNWKQRKEWNKILNEIKEPIKKEKENNIQSKLEEFESRDTDVSKCFEVVRLLKRKTPKKKLLIVYNGNGNIVNTEKQQTDEITTFFREIFGKDNQGTTKEYPPSSIKKTFHRRRD